MLIWYTIVPGWNIVDNFSHCFSFFFLLNFKFLAFTSFLSYYIFKKERKKHRQLWSTIQFNQHYYDWKLWKSDWCWTSI